MTTILRDRYEPLETVGRGGQGEVMRALDRLHGTTVAIKIRPVRWPAEREEILEEARLLRALRPHPGVTLVREDFFDGDRYVMVMDWIEGRPSSRLLDEEGALSLERAAGILAQAASALDHMHSHDPPIVHGDVKPANLVVAPDGHVVLVDFGIAVRGSSAARMSTSRYAAPEVARGEPLTPASDVYSLAATALTLLTGEPFELGTRPRLGLPRPEASRIARVLSKALHPDPRRRPRSAVALVEGLAPQTHHNLPTALSSFVGRRRELRDARALLKRSRLVTLAGPGGVGKTRLAVAIASAALGEFPRGVWLVQLAGLIDPTLVADEVARTLGVAHERAKTVEDRIARFLGERRALVILDNAEHILEGVALAARVLLEACPELTILATSREPLGTGGEAVLRVPTLSLPADLDATRRSEAVRLFCDRARSARRSFRLTADTAPAIAEICRRLDGIPLALELAAARVASFEPAELAARLDERFRLLASTPQSLPHHRTLRATVSWSFDLLSDAERTLLTRLSVFVGGFDLDAACEVCVGEGISADEVPAVLSRLVEKSLVLRDDAAGPSRYRMLETVRELAAEGLQDDVRRRHLRWCAALAGPDELDAAALERLSGAMDDLRSALGWSVVAAPPDALALACSLAHLWLVRGHFAEGRAWIERALAAASDPAEEGLRGRALNQAGNLARGAGEHEVAKSLLAQCLTLQRAAGDRVGEAKALNSLGVVAMDQGDNARAGELFEESAAIGRELNDVALVDAPVGNLGIIAVAEGDFARARELHSESLAIAHRRGDAVGVAYSLENLGVVEQHLGDTAKAIRLYRESLAMLRDLGDTRAISDVLLLFGEIALAEGRFTDAARLFATSDTARAEVGSPLPEYARPLFDQAVAAMRIGAGEDAFRSSWEAGARAALLDVVASLLDG